MRCSDAAPAAARHNSRAELLCFPRASQRCLDFVRSRAPLVVHFKAETALPLLAKDTHYRNQFETRVSGGALNATARHVQAKPLRDYLQRQRQLRLRGGDLR